MPNMSHLESGFTGFTTDLVPDLVESFRNRSKNMRCGFKTSIKKELLRFKNSKYKTKILDKLDTCPDCYPSGYYHGDMGFANMIIEDGRIYMIDFSDSFIDSPLVDIASMFLSLSSALATTLHSATVVQIVYKLKYDLRQIDVIAKTKILSYFRDDDNEERKLELEQLFNGFL